MSVTAIFKTVIVCELHRADRCDARLAQGLGLDSCACAHEPFLLDGQRECSTKPLACFIRCSWFLSSCAPSLVAPAVGTKLGTALNYRILTQRQPPRYPRDVEEG